MKVRIRSIAPGGFRRCGVLFPREGTIVGGDRFTPEQWERLRAEPALAVEPAAEEGEGPKPESEGSASEPAKKGGRK